MADKTVAPLVYMPETIQQLLQIYKKNPTAEIHAGGTYSVIKTSPQEPLPGNSIIYIGNIEEMKRISRTDRYVEIGAGCSINQVLGIGSGILPRALVSALQQIGSYTIRNLATIGGGLAVKERRLDAFTVLSLFDVRVEGRKAGSSRWIQPARLFDETNRLAIGGGEVLTRIRVPVETWDVQVYKKIRNRTMDPKENFIFCGLAKLQKGQVQDFRFCFGGIQRGVLREKSIEAEITGKKLPLQKKTLDTILGALEKKLDSYEEEVKTYQRRRAPIILKWFIDLLTED